MVDRIKKLIKARLGKKGRAKLIFRNLCEEGRIAGPKGSSLQENQSDDEMKKVTSETTPSEIDKSAK